MPRRNLSPAAVTVLRVCLLDTNPPNFLEACFWTAIGLPTVGRHTVRLCHRRLAGVISQKPTSEQSTWVQGFRKAHFVFKLATI